MKLALHLPKSFCCWQVYAPGGFVSEHAFVGGGVVETPHRPHVLSQKVCMKLALHLPKSFCCWQVYAPGGFVSEHTAVNVASARKPAEHATSSIAAVKPTRIIACNCAACEWLVNGVGTAGELEGSPRLGRRMRNAD
jgi:hypothetical protein